MAYVARDFSVAPLSNEGTESVLLVNDVALLVDTANGIVGLSGYCPNTEWVSAGLQMPPSTRRVVRVVEEGFDMTGIPSRVNGTRWPVWHDATARIVCIGDRDADQAACIEAVEGVVLAFECDGGSLVSVWIDGVP